VIHEVATKVADALLYEGYMLYPYRPSAIKNRQRWSFGILYPPAYPEVPSGTERCQMHSECLLEVSPNAVSQNQGSRNEAPRNAVLQLELRFLHLLSRQVGKPSESDSQAVDLQACNLENLKFEPVPFLVIDDRRIESWDEGVERSVQLELSLEPARQQFQFRFPSSRVAEPLRHSSGQLAGSVSRTQQEVTGTISVLSETIGDGLLKLTIDISNTTAPGTTFQSSDLRDRNLALLHSLVSAHTILSVTGAQFVSLLDPPDALRNAVSSCNNVGNFPVLVGVPPERDMLLCSPIILYDYPQIAPESGANYCDSTEMDEMLTLRIMTLTDEEKDEMRCADDQIRSLLQFTEQSASQQLMRTHGPIRPASTTGSAALPAQHPVSGEQDWVKP
jgi:hydrogenase maturation protease